MWKHMLYGLVLHIPMCIYILYRYEYIVTFTLHAHLHTQHIKLQVHYSSLIHRNPLENLPWYYWMRVTHLPEDPYFNTLLPTDHIDGRWKGVRGATYPSLRDMRCIASSTSSFFFFITACWSVVQMYWVIFVAQLVVAFKDYYVLLCTVALDLLKEFWCQYVIRPLVFRCFDTDICSVAVTSAHGGISCYFLGAAA